MTYRRRPTVLAVLTVALAMGSTLASGALPEGELIRPEAGSFEPEHRYGFQVVQPSGHHVVVQGSVDVTPYEIVGLWMDEYGLVYDVQLVVGPYWHDVSSVVPTVTIDGYHNRNADEDDEQSWEISELTWDTVHNQGPDFLQRIRLKFKVVIRGEYSQLTRLGYSFFARGRQLGPDGVAEPGPVKPQGAG